MINLIKGGNDMIKKSVLIISIVLLLLSQISYATEYSLAEFDNKIDIVSPSIGTSGNVIIANNLYISIRIDEPIESHIKLVKVEEFEIEMGILDKVFLNIELTEEEKDQIYGANIARNYFSLRDRLEKLKKDFAELENSEIEDEIIYREALENEIKITTNQLEFYRESYENIFQTVIMEEEMLTYEGILPFYERSIPILEDGEYKLVFSDLSDNVIKEMAFTIKSKETVANEIIKNIPMRLIKILEITE